MKSSIKKLNSEFEVVEKENQKFTISINENEKIIIYDKELLEKVIDNKFNKKYRKLLYLVMEVKENDDSDDEKINIVLLKTEELKNLLLSKYYKYINKEILNKYLKMILLLEEKLNVPKRGRGR